MLMMSLSSESLLTTVDACRATIQGRRWTRDVTVGLSRSFDDLPRRSVRDGVSSLDVSFAPTVDGARTSEY